MLSRRLELDRRTDAPASTLDELYVRHAPGGRRLAYLLTGSTEAAEDLVHDAFVRLAGRFRHLRHREAFGAYLRRTIVNLHVSRLRRLRLERAFADTRRAEDHTAGLDVVVRHDLWAALTTLPARQRAALVLRYYEDLRGCRVNPR
ncbi:MAG: sigma-70 family RNA polymerase sigma factor [Actinomycetota bacterium]